MKDGVLTVVNDDGSVKVHAKAVGVYTRMDHGLITGNFKDIPGAKLSSDQLDIPKAVVACGYPLGSFALNCYLLIPRINDGFLIKCSGGPLLPGQSGGPVFDKSGNVVGLNVQVYDAEQQGGVAYTPVVGILSIFKIGR
jgi:S1-C subfamily serine protease